MRKYVDIENGKRATSFNMVVCVCVCVCVCARARAHDSRRDEGSSEFGTMPPL